MDPLDVASKHGANLSWVVVALICAYTGYLATKHMVPVWAERYKLRTQLLTDKDARHATEIVRKLNGREMAEIERHLYGSQSFRERFAPMHRIAAIEGEQQRILRDLDEHVREDRAVHDRVKGLEVQMEDVKSDVHEIKTIVREGTKAVAEEAKALRSERTDGERRILEHIDRLYDRRKEPRA